MNILVVDDEYYIVKNIIETTDWSALGIEQAFPAYSASQAKQIFEGSQDIDVLLTDIEMPRETGLQLVEWLHENDFHPIVLVLTGHQRFDYAQEALNLHIFSYLLKPIDPDQLMEKLTAAVQEVKKNAWYEKERLNMEEHLSTDTSDPISVIKDYIRSHLSDPDLGRTSITDKIHMNPDYLSHIFSTKTGASLSSYIMDERMAAAKRLLATTSFSPQQICDQIGIANVSYFYRQFKKGCGERRMRELRGKLFSMVFQNPMTSLNPTMTVGAQIAEAVRAHQKDMGKEEVEQRVTELMQLVGIEQAEERKKAYPYHFSGGMRQRIVLAIALAGNPEILFADEPTTALDVTIQAQILDLLREIQKKLGTATVFVTHDLGVVARIADRVAVMYAGKIVEIGTVDEIFYDPRHPYTWGLLRSIPAFSRGKESLPSIPGMPPSLLHPPKGDAFASRNAYALEIDFEEEPPMFRVTDSHYAATWLLDERAPKVVPPIGGNTDGT